MVRILTFLCICLFSFSAYAGSLDLIDINSVTGIPISCTTTAAATALSNPNAPNVRVYNDGPDTVLLATGASTVATNFPTNAAVVGVVVPAGAIETFQKLPSHTHISCDTASSTATVYVSTGIGE